MPAGPLFSSKRNQRLAVAGLMAATFVGAMMLASLLTMAGPGGAPGLSGGIEGKRESTSDNPADWPRDHQAERQTSVEDQILQDPDRPTRRLRVFEIETLRPRSPRSVMHRIVPKLLPPGLRERISSRLRHNELGPLTLMTWIGQAPPGGGDGRAQHLISVMTLDGRQFWVVHLSDRVTGAGTSASDRLRENLNLLHRYIASALVRA